MLSFEEIVLIFEEIERLLIGSLRRNLARHSNEEKDEGFKWTAWQAEKLRSVDRFRRENKKLVQKYVPVVDYETKALMQEQFREGEELADNYIDELIGDDASLNKEPAFFGVNKDKVNKLIEDVTKLEKDCTTSALRLTDDVYRQTVNRVQLAMSTGSMTLPQALDISVKDFLDKGINSIVYRDGRRVNIADYVRMVLRTTSTRATLQGMSQRAKELGYDTVLISAYSMCSETCLPWQGRVYIDDVFSVWQGEKSGDKGKSLYCGKWFPLLSSAIRGGLFHPNCRHTMTVWIDGVSVLPPPLDNSKIEANYKLEQRQRALEREVRKAKRKVEGLSDPENVRKAKAELREAQRRLKDFIDKVNADEGETILKRDYGRETSYGAAELTETEKNDIIKQEEEQRKRAAEIHRIREEVIPYIPTDKLAPRQGIHHIGTNLYEKRKSDLKLKDQYGPSYLTISDEKVLELVNKFKGTGEIKLGKRTGKWDNEETILDNDEIVGISVNNLNGKAAETTVFKIHYSKNGVHIVPDYPSKKRRSNKNDNERNYEVF